MKTDYIQRRDLEHVLALLMPTNRLVMEVCLHTGLRIGDVLAIRTDQLGTRLTVRERKTGKNRRVGLTSALVERIIAQAGDVWAFPGRDPDKHRTRQAVWADLHRAARALRMPETVGTHSARKIYAVNRYRRSGRLSDVQKALNHSSPEITMIYALSDKITQERLSRQRRRPP